MALATRAGSISMRESFAPTSNRSASAPETPENAVSQDVKSSSDHAENRQREECRTRRGNEEQKKNAHPHKSFHDDARERNYHHRDRVKDVEVQPAHKERRVPIEKKLIGLRQVAPKERRRHPYLATVQEMKLRPGQCDEVYVFHEQ